MSRHKRSHSPEPAGLKPADNPTSFNTARIAEEIGMEALGMAKWARAAGLTTLGFLLESAALEAGAQVAALQWPDDAPPG
ncbi:MAG: hypothetical protein WBD53_12080 [Xanthobacteraceae bacterium]